MANGEEKYSKILGSEIYLEKEAASSLYNLLKTFAGSEKRLNRPGVKEDILKSLTSGYRSKEKQQLMLNARNIYKSWLSEGGVGEIPKEAYFDNTLMDNPVALPGRSKHQSGTAIDISSGSYLNKWMRKQKDWHWYGEKDPVHFEYRPAVDIAMTSMLKEERPLIQ